MLAVLLLLTCIIGMSAGMVGNMFVANFNDAATQRLNRGVSSGRNYINSVMLSAANLAADAEVVNELAKAANAPLTRTLDNACNYALKINAITVYAADGRVYTSSNIAEVPSLAELGANERINDFFTLESDELVSMRTEAVAEFYNDSAYDPALGVISCCHKIFADDKSVLGYVFCDIFPYELYGSFAADDEKDEKTLAMLRFDDEFFPYAGNGEYLRDFVGARKMQTDSSDGRYRIVTNTRNFYGGTIGIAVPLARLKSRIIVFVLALVAIGLGALAIVHFIVRAVAGKVVGKLTHLMRRMESEGYENAP